MEVHNTHPTALRDSDLRLLRWKYHNIRSLVDITQPDPYSRPSASRESRHLICQPPQECGKTPPIHCVVSTEIKIASIGHPHPKTQSPRLRTLDDRNVEHAPNVVLGRLLPEPLKDAEIVILQGSPTSAFRVHTPDNIWPLKSEVRRPIRMLLSTYLAKHANENQGVN